jgi:hypothetical protein
VTYTKELLPFHCGHLLVCAFFASRELGPNDQQADFKCTNFLHIEHVISRSQRSRLCIHTHIKRPNHLDFIAARCALIIKRAKNEPAYNMSNHFH